MLRHARRYGCIDHFQLCHRVHPGEATIAFGCPWIVRRDKRRVSIQTVPCTAFEVNCVTWGQSASKTKSLGDPTIHLGNTVNAATKWPAMCSISVWVHTAPGDNPRMTAPNSDVMGLPKKWARSWPCFHLVWSWFCPHTMASCVAEPPVICTRSTKKACATRAWVLPDRPDKSRRSHPR